jgi:hypothetical protein
VCQYGGQRGSKRLRTIGLTSCMTNRSLREVGSENIKEEKEKEEKTKTNK